MRKILANIGANAIPVTGSMPDRYNNSSLKNLSSDCCSRTDAENCCSIQQQLEDANEGLSNESPSQPGSDPFSNKSEKTKYSQTDHDETFDPIIKIIFTFLQNLKNRGRQKQLILFLPAL